VSATAAGTLPKARRTSRVRRSIRRTSVFGLLPLLIVLAIWQVVGSDSALSFPRPSAWWTSIKEMYEQGVLMPAIWRTLGTFALSLVIATILGAIVGMAIGASRTVDRAMSPLLDFFRALPPPAIVPVGALLLGATFQMGVTVAVVAIIWPILLNTAAAMRGIPLVRREMARSIGLTRAERLFKVTIPSLGPFVALGVRVAVSIALIVTLLVDILGSGEGLGRLIAVRQESFDAAAVWGLLLIIGLFGYVLNVGLAFAEARIFRNWPPGSRA
jgi:sulfonate transport system permease protein